MSRWDFVRPSRRTTLKLLGAGAALAAMAHAPAMAFTVSDAAKAEGQVVVATAGGMLQDALAQHLYDAFTQATGIKVVPVTINPDEQWAKVKADSESGNVQWDLVNVGPDSLVLHKDFLLDLGPNCEAVPNLQKNGAEGVCQQRGFLYILGGYILGVNTKTFPEGGPKNSTEFFDTTKFPGPRAMAGNEPVYNMMIALTADGVPQDQLFPIDIKRALAKMDTIKPSIASWWDSSDQAMTNWRSGEVVMSMFWAGRIPQLRKAGEPIVPVWAGFPKDISGFGILAEAPHKEAAKAFIDFFFADESAQRVLDLSQQINYDPPNKKSLELPNDVDPTTRATYPANWNALLTMDNEKLAPQRKEIEEAWQEWIAK
jgi:spermidine/putrescine-binding protein